MITYADSVAGIEPAQLEGFFVGFQAFDRGMGIRNR